MTARFNETGARGLLLNNIPIDSNLDLLLESKENEEKIFQKAFSLSDEIKETLQESLLKYISLEDLSQTSICPDLDYFKSFTKISEDNYDISIDKKFENDLKLNKEDTNDENEMENSNQFEETNSICREPMEIDVNNNYLDANSNDLINNNTNKIEIMDNYKEISMSMINNIDKLGDGNKTITDIVPQFIRNNFNNFHSRIENLNSKRISKKNLKIENTIVFSEYNEIKREEIFLSKQESRKKSIHDKQINSRSNKLLNKVKKIRIRPHYEMNNYFKLFMIPDKFIAVSYENNEEERRKEFEDLIPVDADENQIEEHCEDKLNLEILDERYENMAILDKDYQKKFGKLYKTFDVRFVKNKIWETINETEMETQKKKMDFNISFRNVLENISKKFTPEVKSNLTTQTCFVCMLHLANEKNLELEELSFENFTISK